jgi:tetratricopeptide (TPR) repeat protein
MDDCKNVSNCEKCLAIVAYGSNALHDGNFMSAEASFRAALVLAQSTPPDEARELIPLALCNLSLLRQRQGRMDESQRFREDATTRLERDSTSMSSAVFQHLMADVLTDLNEYRRAIPFFERAIQLEHGLNDPVATADLLWRVGECYGRSGLKDHAVFPLRAAAKIFRNSPEDPRLSSVLVALGNALRKSTPAEAESCFREAAELHVARGQLQSATPAWVNLAIICSEQGRYTESLELNERVLRVREQSPGIPRVRIATVLNNIANCYRRLRKFAEALASVDSAIELLKADGGAVLAAAYGTRGLIFRDDGRDEEAVKWLRKAHVEHQKLPSPNLTSIAEDLENEIAVLKRLGRPKEEATAEAQLETVRMMMKTVPQPNQDLYTANAPTQGAVFLELSFGGWTNGPTKNDATQLTRRLSELAESQNAGFCAGRATIPESTILIFYGAEAEALFHVLEPSLKSEPLCAGARVTIRQHDLHREVILPSRLN